MSKINNTHDNNKTIATIIGISTPSEVALIVDPKIVRTKPLEQGELVVIEYPEEVIKQPVIAMISKIALTNENLIESLIRSPDSIERLKILGRIEDGERLGATARILGYLDEKRDRIISPRFPPYPGAKVHRAPKEILAKIFGKGHITIGELRSHKGVEVKLNVDELVSKHFAVLAITGAGKSYSIAVIVSRIVNQLNGSIVIIDPHEDYVPFEDNKDIKGDVVVFSAKKTTGRQRIAFKLKNFGHNELLDLLEIPDSATIQRELFSRAYWRLQEKKIDWDLDDLKNEINEIINELRDDIEVDEKGKEKIKGSSKAEANRLENSKFGLFARIDLAPAKDVLTKSSELPVYNQSGPSLVKPNQISIITLTGLASKTQQTIVDLLARKIFLAGQAQVRNEPTPHKLPCAVLMVIEEAHNFIPASGRSSKSLKQIGAEGRKFGVGLGLVSQRPGRLDSDVLSQCNTQIILRIVNPFDQQQILRSSESLSEDLLNDLPSLNVGEAVIVGPSLPIPALVTIASFDGKLGGKGVKITESWKAALELQKGSSIKPQKYEDTFDID
ncbi:MAG TPA: ATP-binding protein [Candidatus Bathyarchaeia archaeon]|nr:ATP-binding protein [Candidatus Bathyarchaeia archaeon]